MAWVPYKLEERNYEDLPEDLRVEIDRSEWGFSDESQRASILMNLGLPPHEERG